MTFDNGLDDEDSDNPFALTPPSPRPLSEILAPESAVRQNSVEEAPATTLDTFLSVEVAEAVPVLARARARATKSPSKPRKAKPRLRVVIEPTLLESPLGELIYSALTAHTTASRPTPFGCQAMTAPVVAQSLTWESVAGDAAEQLPMACAYIPAADFLHAMEFEYAFIYDRILQLRAHMRDSYGRIFLLVEGFSATPDDSAAYVLSLTREIAALPQTAPSGFLSHVSRLTSLRVTATGETTNEYSNAWLRMLQMIPGVSEDVAQRILDYYPTFSSLMTVYMNPSIPSDVKQILLAEKLRANSIEIVLSKRIYTVFTATNPRTVA
ncbi:hypothetical protein ACHHYP_01040 [Achlya hypogyna]|uniref:ERCC4 domain-containing protein n=1 Tax=Achlya hypogyna TaxID=1202772 RepID=A0A1V9Z9U7_ACHHY|nr:hypothetical protein ACHHYP_01040 [Achlya hypogyna]